MGLQGAVAFSLAFFYTASLMLIGVGQYAAREKCENLEKQYCYIFPKELLLAGK